jgi:hypothetical protein
MILQADLIMMLDHERLDSSPARSWRSSPVGAPAAMQFCVDINCGSLTATHPQQRSSFREEFENPKLTKAKLAWLAAPFCMIYYTIVNIHYITLRMMNINHEIVLKNFSGSLLQHCEQIL